MTLLLKSSANKISNFSIQNLFLVKNYDFFHFFFKNYYIRMIWFGMFFGFIGCDQTSRSSFKTKSDLFDLTRRRLVGLTTNALAKHMGRLNHSLQVGKQARKSSITRFDSTSQVQIQVERLIASRSVLTFNSLSIYFLIWFKWF